ncbi:MAG: ArgP/LysG family DNA-binding transcriptional regulator [Spirochaetales bacterium]|nr:ArgP/LysG family DNA-binding transcriptional regulator [Spirochaetales bacterium]
MFEYRQLEALGAVIEYGGFDKAAEKLGLTQSAVTHRIKHLETYAGQPLLIRSNPPVPTQEGLPFYSHYKKMRLLEKDLKAEIGKEEVSTALSLGVNASTLGSWFLPVLRNIMDHTLIDLHVGEAKVVHNLLQQGELAGCISIRSKSTRGCYVEYLGQLVLRCVASWDFKRRFFSQGINADDMKKAPVVLFHKDSQMMRMFQKNVLNEKPFDVPTHIVPPQYEYFEMISSGRAYGFIPEPFFNLHQVEKELIDLSPLSPIIIPQYWHRWGIESELLELLTAEIRQAAKDNLQQSPGASATY